MLVFELRKGEDVLFVFWSVLVGNGFSVFV